MILTSLTYRNKVLISAPKIDTDLLWDLSMLFIGLAIVYFIGVFFYRNRLSSSTKKVRERKRELSPMISEFLFLEEDASKQEKTNYLALKVEIRELIKDPFNRRVLSEVLLDLRKDISGEAQQSLFRLYQDLGLHKDAYAKLKGWRWQIISKGIRELTQMEVAESYGFITKFINDKRATIRKQAEIATVTLRHEGINYFLDTTKYKISEWQQLKLLDVIRNKEDFKPPRFKGWLTSNNKYVVLFALRLIKYYNQNDAKASLIELVKHKNNQIKEEAIACIKEFHVTEALDMLKLVFWKCSTTIKIAILDAIAEIGGQSDIEFLKLIDKKELNFSVKSKALSSINAISPESIMPSKGLHDESRYEIPEDITEAVAKIHAQKHAELTGDHDVEYTDEELAEKLISEAKNESRSTDERKNESALSEINTPVKSNEDEIQQDIASKEDIDDTANTEKENNAFNAIHNIEVVVEKEVVGEFDNKKTTDINWESDHLNFLPIVTDEEVLNKDTSSLAEMSVKAKLNNIDVFYEVIIPYEEHEAIDAAVTTEQEQSLIDENDINELSFLPIVVDNPKEENDKSPVMDENLDIPIAEIEIEYDIVQSVKEEENNEENHFDSDLVFDLEALHELKDVNLTDVDENSNSLDYQQYATEEIRNTQTIYEEVVDKTEITHLDLEVIEPYLFTEGKEAEKNPELYSEKVAQNEEVNLPIENEQFLQKIIEELVSFDDGPKPESIIDDSYVNPDWDLDESELDFVPVSFEKETDNQPSYIRVEKNSNDFSADEIEIPRASLPKAIFGDIEFEASTRQLLNDLAEMGDQREIPFLKELLNHEKYDIFKDRILSLISSFDQLETKEELDDILQPFSVFQDLFRTCDEEAKLILLNEVVAAGDEKEIHFLEGLLTDDSPQIRKVASGVLKELRNKLFEAKQLNSEINVLEVSKTECKKGAREIIDSNRVHDPNDMFDLNFDISEDLKNNEDEKKNDTAQKTLQYGSFFGQINSFSAKIKEQLNG